MGFIDNFTKLIFKYGNQLKIKDKDKAILEIANEIVNGGGDDNNMSIAQICKLVSNMIQTTTDYIPIFSFIDVDDAINGIKSNDYPIIYGLTFQGFRGYLDGLSFCAQVGGSSLMPNWINSQIDRIENLTTYSINDIMSYSASANNSISMLIDNRDGGKIYIYKVSHV